MNKGKEKGWSPDWEDERGFATWHHGGSRKASVVDHRGDMMRWYNPGAWGLGEITRRSGTRVLCHGDLWPAHVCFDGDDFASFVDFESSAFAPSAVDLAQLIGHFGGWGARGVVLGANERIALLGERCGEALRREAPLEVVADLVGEGPWALRALYGQVSSEMIPVQREAHALDISVLLGCLEDASGEVEELLS